MRAVEFPVLLQLFALAARQDLVEHRPETGGLHDPEILQWDQGSVDSNLRRGTSGEMEIGASTLQEHTQQFVYMGPIRIVVDR